MLERKLQLILRFSRYGFILILDHIFVLPESLNGKFGCPVHICGSGEGLSKNMYLSADVAGMLYRFLCPQSKSCVLMLGASSCRILLQVGVEEEAWMREFSFHGPQQVECCLRVEELSASRWMEFNASAGLHEPRNDGN
ncbi:hypothetical protein ATANTOWER_022608 [Ataeniobius toweri]|uniref:Uncharacterized protein n=1 Tax=Ataeniobius toweri TaxID=208326 RepID=A0ABU7CL89_9TELE|nr:hypothetical protein [Ataeniobius toweri]